MRPRRRGRPEALGPLLRRVLDDLGAGDAARVVRIAEAWERALGPEIADHCRPIGLRGEVLLAAADSSVWCQQLQMQTPEILAALRRAFGDDAPREIRFRLASPSPPGVG